MKANLKMADFTAKTGRFHPGHDKPWPHRKYIMRQRLGNVRYMGYLGFLGYFG
jgi:hypothetical protein